MPGMYSDGDFDLAGFAVGAMERGQALPMATRPGDILLGLTSSGLHSNGYSLVRRIVADSGLDWQAPCPFGPDHADAGTLGAALLGPTRIYVKPVLAAIRSGGVRAVAHITGGGLTENLPRVLDHETVAMINLDTWTLPPVFHWLTSQTGLSETEALKTFNCGVGMVLVTPPEAAETVSATLTQAGETVLRLGEIAAGNGPAVQYRGTLA
jgi:phosphoribosylformylglycinamidine cyclo-ligase